MPCLFSMCLLVYSGVQHLFLSYFFTFLVPCCEVCCDFRIKPIFCTSLHAIFVGELICYLCYVCLFGYSVKHGSAIWLTWRVICKMQEMLSFRVHLGSPQVFWWVRAVDLFSPLLFCLSSTCVLCARCCQCFWIVHSWLHLQFSFIFIYMLYIKEQARAMECKFVPIVYSLRTH